VIVGAQTTVLQSCSVSGCDSCLWKRAGTDNANTGGHSARCRRKGMKLELNWTGLSVWIVCTNSRDVDLRDSWDVGKFWRIVMLLSSGLASERLYLAVFAFWLFCSYVALSEGLAIWWHYIAWGLFGDDASRLVSTKPTAEYLMDDVCEGFGRKRLSPYPGILLWVLRKTTDSAGEVNCWTVGQVIINDVRTFNTSDPVTTCVCELYLRHGMQPRRKTWLLSWSPHYG